MGADLSEVDSIVLLAHVDCDAEPAGVFGDQIGRNAGGDIAIKELAVPMAREGIVIGGHEPLHPVAVYGDARVHTTVPVVVMLHEIEELFAPGRDNGDHQLQVRLWIDL